MTPAPSNWLHFACEQSSSARAARYDFTLKAPWTCIFGPSGSGKTTLLKLIAGLLQQTNGTCTLHGRELRGLAAHRRSVAVVDQNASVFPHRTVRENVGFSQRSSKADANSRISQLVERFGLSGLENMRSHQLSGGEAQRVVLARAIFSEPDALLLDESFSGMDRALRTQLRTGLRATQAERAAAGRPMPIVSVSHDVGDVFASADDVLCIQNGRVVAQGPADAVLADERAALVITLQTPTVL